MTVVPFTAQLGERARTRPRASRGFGTLLLALLVAALAADPQAN